MKTYHSVLMTILCTAPGGTAIAQTAGQEAAAVPSGAGDIIATAQKRSQSINAATGESLQSRGITGPADLRKIVPSFIYTRPPAQTPVYTLRAIGFYYSTLASSRNSQ